MVLDVRSEIEWATGHIENAVHLPLPQLIARDIDQDPDQHISVICMSGYRSNIGASILKQRGYRNVYSVIGGMSTWRAAGYPTS